MIAESSDNQGTKIPHQQQTINGNGNVVNFNVTGENSISDATAESNEKSVARKKKKREKKTDKKTNKKKRKKNNR